MSEVTTTAYVIYDDGTTERQRYTGSGEALMALSKPGRFVSESEYNSALAAVTASNAAHLDELLAAEQMTLKADYDALISVGIPDSGARRMSGYAGD